MVQNPRIGRWARFLILLASAGPVVPGAIAATCTTQSQMSAAQRDTLSTAARMLVAKIQAGDVQGIQANTIPAVAADFSGIASSIQYLKPIVQQAVVIVNELYVLDASSDPAGAARTDFFCGNPLVVLNFTNLPPATYALAILQATGVADPQQISLILSKTGENRWMLAGFFDRPMVEAGHDGLWYWSSARQYAQKKMNWDAWLYYRIATNLLSPLDFLSSSNLDKIHHEADQAHPDSLPGAQPMLTNANGGAYSITAIDTTTQFGPLDLDVHYTPDAVQAAQLRDPPAARRQATGVLSTLLASHPELQAAFHGIWVHADKGNVTLFALELPMSQITLVQQAVPAGNATPLVNAPQSSSVLSRSPQ